MEEQQPQRARFVSRSPGMGGAGASSSAGSAGNGSGGGRSQWRGMDLHTSTPSSHRRAMYISPVPLQTNTANHAGSGHSVNSTTSSSGDATRMRAEAAALSARNQVLHRRLSERKRFDSADYAMKMVRSAMQSDTKETVPTPTATASPSPPPAPASLPTTASPPPVPTSGSLAALQSPRLSPTHGRMVFAQALKAQDGRARDLDYEMQDAPPLKDNQDTGSPSPRPVRTQTVAPARGYGGLLSASTSGGNKQSANAALSARNIMIQKKLQEKRHFDSADYQLARLGVSNDVSMEDVGEPALGPRALLFTRTPAPMTLNVVPTAASPVNSPSAARAAISRSNQMSPSARASSGATAFGGQGGAGKYGGLAGRSPAAKPQNDLRRNTLLRQQESFLAAQNPSTSPVPQQQQPSPVPASSGSQKYGKLIAANILLRKNLKERQRFDSADYEMEAAAKQADRAVCETVGRSDNNASSKSSGGISGSTSNQDDEPSSPVMTPQAKHIKLSDDAALSAWAGHPKGAAAAQQAQQPVAKAGGWSGHPAVAAARQTVPQARDDGARLAARNVLLSRKLSVGKKHFDSGEYFAAKDKEARAASNRGQV